MHIEKQFATRASEFSQTNSKTIQDPLSVDCDSREKSQQLVGCNDI